MDSRRSGNTRSDVTETPAPPPPDPPGAPQPAPPASDYPPPAYYVPPKNSGRAIASLVLGICATAFGLFWLYWIGSVIGVVCGILAVIFGRRSKREIAASNGTVVGGGMAKAGIVCGWIGLVLGVIGLIGLGVVVWWLSTDDWI